MDECQLNIPPLTALNHNLLAANDSNRSLKSADNFSSANNGNNFLSYNQLNLRKISASSIVSTDIASQNKNSKLTNNKKIKPSRSIRANSLTSTTKKLTNKFFRRDSAINSRIIPFLILIKETRTAFMLFIISIVFIASYLPSILATRSFLPNDNLYLVYLYFTNSAINPLIYSFMNRSFRSDLKKLFTHKSRPVFSASRFSSLNAYSLTPNNKFELRSF